MSLPPYCHPGSDVSRLPGYLPPYTPHAAIETPRPSESSPVIYGRFTKDLFGQYLHDTAPAAGPLHPLATHGSLHDQHPGILGPYQQSSALPTMPHGAGGGSELFRRAYSGVSDNLFGGMKSPAPATAQSQHWMTGGDTARRWNATPPTMHDPRYNYPPGRTDDSSAKTLAPPAMSKRPDEMLPSSGPPSYRGPLSARSVYSPGGAAYPHPALPSSVTPDR